MRQLIAVALVAALAACTAERAPAETEAVASPPAVDTPSPAPATPGDPPAPEATPPAGSDGSDAQASFGGYGDVAFGTAAADMAKAWGGDLKEVGKAYNEACYFMTPAWVKNAAEFNFMISNGMFARFGTDSAKYAAPGGGKVGMTKAQVAALYPGLEEQVHKYTDGQYLRIKDPAGGKGVLLFETDAAGNDAKVTEWRVGVAPEIDYVEGCS